MAWIFLFHGIGQEMYLIFSMSSSPALIGLIITYVVSGSFLYPKNLKGTGK
jgi:hypothetical protein